MNIHFEELTVEVTNSRVEVLNRLDEQQKDLKAELVKQMVKIAKTLRECAKEQKEDMAQQFSKQTGVLFLVIFKSLYLLAQNLDSNDYQRTMVLQTVLRHEYLLIASCPMHSDAHSFTPRTSTNEPTGADRQHSARVAQEPGCHEAAHGGSGQGVQRMPRGSPETLR